MKSLEWKNLIQKIFFLILIVLLQACNSSQNQDCDFATESILNGDSIPTQISEWDCQQQNSFFTIALFSDGTGLHSNLGNFTWQKQACGYSYHSSLGSGQVSGLVLSNQSQQLNFTDNFQGQFTSVFCTLDETPDGTSF